MIQLFCLGSRFAVPRASLSRKHTHTQDAKGIICLFAFARTSGKRERVRRKIKQIQTKCDATSRLTTSGLAQALDGNRGQDPHAPTKHTECVWASHRSLSLTCPPFGNRNYPKNINFRHSSLYTVHLSRDGCCFKLRKYVHITCSPSRKGRERIFPLTAAATVFLLQCSKNRALRVHQPAR